MSTTKSNLRSEIFDLLYEHQKDSVEACDKSDRGTLILPTGTGKTWIQAANIALDIEESSHNHIYIIQIPRIMLSYQILTEVYGFLNRFDIDCNYLVVHSGNKIDERQLLEIKSDDVMWSDVKVTTSQIQIDKEIQKSNKIGNPLVIIQTYHSADRTFNVLDNMCMIPKMVQNDECQYIVSEQFNHLLKVGCKRFYSFTATAKDASHVGMGNTELWGKRLKLMTPREAVERGIIVRPRMIHFSSKDGLSLEKGDVRKTFPRFVKYDFETLQTVNHKVNNKLLVCTRGTDDIDNFINSKECKEMMDDGIHIFAIGSHDKIKEWYNGQRYSRSEWLNELQRLGKDDDSKVLVLHIDILSEGIDVPGFTGISFYQAKQLDKFTQNYGRTARLHKLDRSRIQAGEISPQDLSDWIKPYSYVILHEFDDTGKSESQELAKMLYNLRQFGFDPVRDVIIKSQRGVSDNEESEDLLTELEKSRIKGKVVEKHKLHYKVESERLASLEAESSNRTLEEAVNNFFDLI